MKFTISTLLPLAILARATNAASCYYAADSDLATHYTVTASGVGDVPGICGGLWDNLKRFPSCVASSTDCSGDSTSMTWQFTASLDCNNGMVGSTWWEATKNKYGSINCESSELE